MTRLRVAQVVPTYLPATRYGGPIESVHGLSRALVEAGHQVSVFTTDVDGDGRSPVPLLEPVCLDGVQVHYHQVTAPRRLYRSPTLRDTLFERLGHFDVVHLHSVFLWPTLVAARCAARTRVPYLIAPRGMLDPALIAARGALRKRAWIHLFERRTLREAWAIHVTAALERRALAALDLELAPVCEVPNGVRIPTGNASTAPRAERRLLFVGRLSPKKGIDQLIPALAGLPGVELILAGPDENGYASELRRIAEGVGVAGQVTFLGLVDEVRRDQLMREATLLVLPSRGENFANVVAEAMVLGCPVLVSRHVGLAEAAVAAGAGALTEVDSKDIGHQLRTLLAVPDQLASMGRAGAALARRRFSWVGVAAAMADLYARAASGEPPPASPPPVNA